MNPQEFGYFDKKFEALDSKLEGAKEDVQVIRTELGDRLQKHKNELIDKMEGIRSEVREQSVQSNARWNAVDKELAIHEQTKCPDVVEHEKGYHNIAKIVGIVVGIATFASIVASALIWLIQKVN
jgi:predicted  nucleic acid-binding Zn-ribbon protein